MQVGKWNDAGGNELSGAFIRIALTVNTGCQMWGWLASQCHVVCPTSGIAAELVGRTPGSARVPPTRSSLEDSCSC